MNSQLSVAVTDSNDNGMELYLDKPLDIPW